MLHFQLKVEKWTCANYKTEKLPGMSAAGLVLTPFWNAVGAWIRNLRLHCVTPLLFTYGSAEEVLGRATNNTHS